MTQAKTFYSKGGRFVNDSLAEALKNAGLTGIDLAYFEHQHHRRFAPLPDCKLRRLASKAGFTSSADFLRSESSRTAS